MTKFIYSIRKINNGLFVLIEDLDSGMSVTNNIEKVIEKLKEEMPGILAAKILYRDTIGEWNEILIKNGQFFKFNLINYSDHLINIITEKISKYPPTMLEV